jgi:hypothetical protein
VALLAKRSVTLRKGILIVGVATSILVFDDLKNAGPRSAEAFELQVESAPSAASSSEKTTLKGQARDSAGWLSLKFDGTLWGIDALGAPASNRSMLLESAQIEPNQLPIGKSAVTDGRATLAMWDDWVRWTSREAVSDYVAPNAALGYLTRSGFGFDNAATSQHLDVSIWKAGSLRVSLFGEYDRVGEFFMAPNFVIKGSDAFFIPNSTATRMGGAVQQGPITFTLEQRTRQGLAQDNAPINVENQIGVWLSFDDLLGRTGKTPGGISWLLPSSAYINVGQGRVRAALDQGVNGDTTSDVSAGFTWNRDKIYASIDYWRSDYQSQLYPWKGWGLDASVGYHEGDWGVDLYFDAYSSMTSYPLAGLVPVLTTDKSAVISGGLLFSRHF